MTFPTDAAMITRRKSLGISTGPAAAIAIYLLPIAWLYRFMLPRFVAGECTGPPRSECVLTRRNCSRIRVDRIATAVSRPPPSVLGNDEKRYHCGERDLIRLSA